MKNNNQNIDLMDNIPFTYEQVSFRSDTQKGFYLLNWEGINLNNSPALIINGEEYLIDVNFRGLTQIIEQLNGFNTMYEFHYDKWKNAIYAVSKWQDGKVNEVSARVLQVYDVDDDFVESGWIAKDKFEFLGIDNPPIDFYLSERDPQFMRGSFDIERTNIYSEKKFAIKRGTPLFISITLKDVFDKMFYDFEWNLFDINDRLLLKSNTNFITYLFSETGNYTVDLTITHKKTKQEKYLRKNAWIQVTL